MVYGIQGQKVKEKRRTLGTRWLRADQGASQWQAVAVMLSVVPVTLAGSSPNTQAPSISRTRTLSDLVGFRPLTVVLPS